MTESATRFVGPDTFAALTGRPVHASLWERPGEVLHVRLAHEADLVVVAPATANLLAKLAHGHRRRPADLDAAGVPRARWWSRPRCTPGMWEHPATRGNVETPRAPAGFAFVGPVDGPLAHGDEGMGRMAEPEDIADEASPSLDGAGAGRSAPGRVVVVTAGPTHEADRPRALHRQPLERQMGIAVAAEAAAARRRRPPGARSRHRRAARRPSTSSGSRPPSRCGPP